MAGCAERTPLAAALLVYLALALSLAHVGPGLNYDEALFQVGAVHLLTSPDRPSFTQTVSSWVPVAGRHWPVMVMPYAGAEGAYLLLPPFWLFGWTPFVPRAAAAVIAAAGLWGLGRLATRVLGPRPAAAAVLALAVHPGLLSNTVFNDSGLTYWVSALGVLALAGRRYLGRPTPWAAAAVGAACGYGLWVRLNFGWLIAAAALGALAGFGRRALPPLGHAGAALAGAVAGGAPLVAWLCATRLRPVLDFIGGSDTGSSGAMTLVPWRLHLLASALLYDSEHRRGIWDGPDLPTWQVAAVCLLAAAGVLAAFVGREANERRRWHRALSVCVLVQALVMVVSRLNVRQHHFVTLVPLVALAVALAAARLLQRWPAAWPGLAAAALLYAAIVLPWDVAMRRGLVETGGTGFWSDAPMRAARYLDGRPGPRVRALDWGFDTGVRVVTGGRVQPRELFWWFYAPTRAFAEEPVWQREIAAGGAFLTHAEAYLPVTSAGFAATARFEKALARSGRPYSRLVFTDRLGRPNTVLVDVAP